MFEPIEISYEWDKETFLQASHIAYKYEMKNSPKRFLGWIFIAMTQFGVVAAFKGGAIGLLLISTFLVVYWYFLRWPLRKAMLSKAFDKSQKNTQRYHVKIEEDTIDVNANKISWDVILEIVSLGEGFLVLIDKTFLFIPRRAFKDIEEKNRFAYIAKLKVKHYQKD